jgi:hypothetical protein
MTIPCLYSYKYEGYSKKQGAIKMCELGRSRMVNKFLFLILAITFSGLLVLNNARAEEIFDSEKFQYKEMQIQVMPEFDYPENWPKDEPSVLVGYYGTIVNKSGKDFNGSLQFPLPVKDKDFSVYLIAEFPEDTKPEVQRPYKIDEKTGMVTWEPGKPIKKDESYDFVIEYYANPYEVDGANKKFSFEFNPQTEIEKLDVIFYSPMNSKDVKIEPSPANTTKSEYGQELNHYQYTNVKQGEAVKYTASYSKEGNESALSIISKMNPPNDENHSGTATDQVTKNGTSPNEKPIIDAVGASIISISIVIAGGFVFFGLRGKRHTAAIRKPQKVMKKKSKNDEQNITVTADERKKLRSMLLNGKIDQQTYEEKMKKLI